MRNISTFLSSLHAALLSTTKGKKKKAPEKSNRRCLDAAYVRKSYNIWSQFRALKKRPLLILNTYNIENRVGIKKIR